LLLWTSIHCSAPPWQDSQLTAAVVCTALANFSWVKWQRTQLALVVIDAGLMPMNWAICAAAAELAKVLKAVAWLERSQLSTMDPWQSRQVSTPTLWDGSSGARCEFPVLVSDRKVRTQKVKA